MHDPRSGATLQRAKTISCLVTALVLGVATFTATAPAEAKDTVKIALAVPWAGYGFWYLAKEKNLDPDLDFDISVMGDPMQSQAMLAAGVFDVVDSTLDYAPIAAEKKLPLKVVAFHTLTHGADQIIMGPNVDLPNGMMGKKVGMLEGFLGQIMMGMWLEKSGVPIDKVSWVNIGPDQAVSPLMTGDIKAAYLFEPWSSQVLKQLQGSKVVLSSDDPDMLKTPFAGDAMYMSDKFLSDRRSVALKTMAAYWKAVDYWHQHPDESAQIMAKALQFQVADVTGTIGSNGSGQDGPLHVNTFDYSANYCGQGANAASERTEWPITKGLKFINGWWIKLGQMKSQVDTSEIVDCKLIGDLVKTRAASK